MNTRNLSDGAALSRRIYRSYLNWLQDHDNKGKGFYGWAEAEYGATRYHLASIVRRKGISKWETRTSERKSGNWKWTSKYNLYLDNEDGEPYYSVKPRCDRDKLIIARIDIDGDFWRCMTKQGLNVDKLRQLTEERINRGVEATSQLEG